jgi:N-ethylmaleimide reductase
MSALFEPFRLGALGLPDSIVMAPLGRARAHVDTREPLPRASTCYAQRATAGLIVSEATHVSVESVGRPGTAAIQSNGQVEAWRRVTDAVHAAGGRIFQQLFELGRKADPTRTRLGMPRIRRRTTAAVTRATSTTRFSMPLIAA